MAASPRMCSPAPGNERANGEEIIPSIPGSGAKNPPNHTREETQRKSKYSSIWGVLSALLCALAPLRDNELFIFLPDGSG